MSRRPVGIPAEHRQIRRRRTGCTLIDVPTQPKGQKTSCQSRTTEVARGDGKDVGSPRQPRPDEGDRSRDASHVRGGLYRRLGAVSAHWAWGYVAAFAEAAMVGAIADWFAVVALFRHPLGLPIPHTAIIPSNKDRIGENLATFICANFLSTEQVLAKLAHSIRRRASPHGSRSHVMPRARSARRRSAALCDGRARRRAGPRLLSCHRSRAARAGRRARLAGQLLDVLTETAGISASSTAAASLPACSTTRRSRREVPRSSPPR